MHYDGRPRLSGRSASVSLALSKKRDEKTQPGQVRSSQYELVLIRDDDFADQSLHGSAM